jgi:hypothetical protein
MAGVVLAAVVVAIVVVIATSGDGSGSGTATSGAADAPPLTAGSTSASGSLVVLPMGDLSDPANTFWELFVRPLGATTWSLATPPGVADNGGLVVGASPAGPVTAAFLPSADLTFSVLAQRAADATTWDPGTIPGVVNSSPDALGTDLTGGVSAVLSQPRPSVVEAGPTLSGWKSLPGLPAIHHTVAGCTVAGYTSVADGPSGSAVVGTRCDDSTRAGLLVSDGSGGWVSAGPAFWNPTPATTEVLRLVAGPDGVSALAERTSATGSSLIAAWGPGSGGSAFARSQPVAIPKGWSVLATAVGGGNGRTATVLLGSSARSARRLLSVAGPGGSWVTAATPPAGTSAAVVIGSEVDAFVPSGSHLAVWSLTPGSNGWSRVARLTVPIQYGSSS